MDLNKKDPSEKKVYAFQIETKDFSLSQENVVEIQQILATALKSVDPYTIVFPNKIDLSIIRKSLGELKRIHSRPELLDKYKSYIQLLDNVSAVRVKEFTIHLDPNIKEEPDYENLIELSKERLKEAKKKLNIDFVVTRNKTKNDEYNFGIYYPIEEAKGFQYLNAKEIHIVADTLRIVSDIIESQAVNLRKEFESLMIPKDINTINKWLESEGLQGCSKDPGQLRTLLKLIGIKKFFMNHMYGDLKTEVKE